MPGSKHGEIPDEIVELKENLKKYDIIKEEITRALQTNEKGSIVVMELKQKQHVIAGKVMDTWNKETKKKER